MGYFEEKCELTDEKKVLMILMYLQETGGQMVPETGLGAARHGAFGMEIHIPFGFNLYAA